MSGTDTTIEESRIPDSAPSQQEDDSHTVDTASKDDTSAAATELVQGTKRPREESENGDGEPRTISKNQLKRLRRQQAWEAAKPLRKLKRKEQRHKKQAKKRTEIQEQVEAAKAAGLDPQEVLKAAHKPEKEKKHNPVPVSFILDCDFESYMLDNEIVSLSSQVVRSYSMNKAAKYQGHLFVSSFGGKMKERFETVLNGNYKKWRGVKVVEGDFLEAATLAREVMAGEQGGELIDVLKAGEKAVEGKGGQTSAVPEPQMEEGVDRSVVYLTSESPYTLDRLEPHTSYVIGGIVDRNREKGLCYKRAVEKKVRTAKLPIGEYMAMQSRFVLTTNQVVEIMAKWLECGDWGQAFLNVIPQRKGGVLKHDSAANQHCGEEVEDGLEGEVAEENGEAETERAAVEETVHDNGLEQATTNGSGLAAAAEATQR